MTVLKHIKFAHNWLSSAENKIKEDNFLEGEMFLSLAEAEVRKAWETSHSSREKQQNNFLRSKLSYAIAVAVMVIILILILGWQGFNQNQGADYTLQNSINYELETGNINLETYKDSRPGLYRLDMQVRNIKGGY